MIKIGVICPSEIAFRRFLPALKQCKYFSYVGIAIASEKEWFGDNIESTSSEEKRVILEKEEKKALSFKEKYGGKIFYGYQKLIEYEGVDAIYLPLPPALHFYWGEKVLQSGKHLLIEKPATTMLDDTQKLLALAKEKRLAVHENYMFVFHEQLNMVQNIIDNKELGELRMIRIDFGFPKRASNDFRYVKALGGGALLDCGGYTLKYARMLLGNSIKIDTAMSNYTDEFDVDLYGSATLSNNENQIIQISFGMDNDYKCMLEIWGSKGRLVTNRILTAPVGFSPSCTIYTQQGLEERKIPMDDTFKKSLLHFAKCIQEETTRSQTYLEIQEQAELVEEFRKRVGKY